MWDQKLKAVCGRHISNDVSRVKVSLRRQQFLSGKWKKACLAYTPTMDLQSLPWPFTTIRRVAASKNRSGNLTSRRHGRRATAGCEGRFRSTRLPCSSQLSSSVTRWDQRPFSQGSFPNPKALPFNPCIISQLTHSFLSINTQCFRVLPPRRERMHSTWNSWTRNGYSQFKPATLGRHDRYRTKSITCRLVPSKACCNVNIIMRRTVHS